MTATVPNTKELLSTRDKEMLGWLPVLGEWYEVTPRSRIFAFEELKDLKTYYSPRTSKPEKDKTCSFSLTEGDMIFITRITLPEEENFPVVFDFLSRNPETKHMEKVMFFAFFPPRTTEGAQIWKMLLKQVVATPE